MNTGGSETNRLWVYFQMYLLKCRLCSRGEITITGANRPGYGEYTFGGVPDHDTNGFTNNHGHLF